VPGRADESGATRRKLIAFDSETFHALDVLARDRMMTIQELADEAFADLLRKHGRPVDLRDALKKSAGVAKPAETNAARRRPSASARRR
jgi:antitoxin-like ribbon-helix-helix protein